MPALHDFAVFAYFAQSVAKYTENILTEQMRKTCCPMVQEIHEGAAIIMGTGQSPGQRTYKSAGVVLVRIGHECKIELKTALLQFSALLEENPKGNYGVVEAYNKGALQMAVVAACIDDTFEEMTWRDAFRYAAAEGSEMTQFLRVILIANAFEKGKLLRPLISLDFEVDADLMTLFGKYVSSDSVSANKILHEIGSVNSLDSDLRRIAMESVMWNLTALDKNDGSSNVRWIERLPHQMYLARVPTKTVQTSLIELVAQAEANFSTELQTAIIDSTRLSRKKGTTYVIGLLRRQTLAWMYISVVVLCSILCAVLDWNKQNQVFDQAKDAFEISTIFLVSVFGLFKLTSEDPNALKNLASGKSLVDDLEDASKLLQSSTESMQKLLGIESETPDWAAADGCSYGRNVYGEGLETGPAQVATLKQCGFFFLEGICKRPHFWSTFDVMQNEGFEVARIAEHSGVASDLHFVKAPRFLKVA